MNTITSAHNPLIKLVGKLSTQKKIRETEGLTVLDGPHLLQEYLKFKGTPSHILVSEKWLKSKESDLLKGLSYQTIPDDLLTKIAPTKNPSGLLSVIKIPNIPNPNAPLSSLKVLLLDHLQDPGNVGTLLRSAVAAGFDHILSLGSCEIWSPKVLRAAQGAHFYPIKIQEIQHLQNLDSITWYSLSCDKKAQNIFEVSWSSPLGLIVGNEGAGVSPDSKTLSPLHVHIPMAHKFESLNAGVAGSLCMFLGTHTSNL